ncbi:MAG: RIP metalloprotease RseP [Bryobacteraceae bacterium]|jgi:regulator of sigma E protease
MVAILENILWLLVLIGVMIMIHELGHFWAARYFDVKVEAFSLGFGPRLFGFRRGETDYRVSAILIGGYVKMAGDAVLVEPATVDNPDKPALALPAATTSAADDPRSLLAKPRWQRVIIFAAGPFMNVVLAIAILTGLYMFKYQKLSDEDLYAVIDHVAAGSPAAQAGVRDGDRIVKLDGKRNPTWEDIGQKEVIGAYRPMYLTIERNGQELDCIVTPTLSERLGVGYAGWDERGELQLYSVMSGFPAEKAGLKKGDVILSVNGQPIHSPTRFQESTRNSGGKPIEIEYRRDGQTYRIQVQPVLAELDGPKRWMIGVAPQQKLHFTTIRLTFSKALQASLEENGKGAFLLVKVIQGMIERRMSPKNLSSPIGIAQMSGAAAREGAAEFLGFMAMISLQLAIFNLLPIPIMDGGAILMLLIEMVMQRDLSLNVKEAVFKVGFVFIMMLLAFAIFNDISRYARG